MDGRLHLSLELKFSADGNVQPDLEVIKLFSCSTQLSTKIQLLIKN